MPALQVRDFPQHLYDGLKRCAEEEHRSMAQQTIQAVEEMLKQRSNPTPHRDPYSGIFERDTEEARQQRIAKRKALFAKIKEEAASLPSNLPKSTEVFRESRAELETRADRIVERAAGGPK